LAANKLAILLLACDASVEKENSFPSVKILTATTHVMTTTRQKSLSTSWRKEWNKRVLTPGMHNCGFLHFANANYGVSIYAEASVDETRNFWHLLISFCTFNEVYRSRQVCAFYPQRCPTGKRYMQANEW